MPCPHGGARAPAWWQLRIDSRLPAHRASSPPVGPWSPDEAVVLVMRANEPWPSLCLVGPIIQPISLPGANRPLTDRNRFCGSLPLPPTSTGGERRWELQWPSTPPEVSHQCGEHLRPPPHRRLSGEGNPVSSDLRAVICSPDSAHSVVVSELLF